MRRIYDPNDSNYNSFVDWVEAIIANIKFENYTFHVTPDREGAKLQATYPEADIRDPSRIETQYTRKWLISPATVESEIVKTAFKLCATSAEHRLREGFTWQGARIFGPHIDVYALLEVARKVDVREDDHPE